MSVQDSVLQILANEHPEGISGEEIAAELGVSRASVWKAIKKLQESGYCIEGVRNKGYRLEGECDPLTERGVFNHLSGEAREKVVLTVEKSTTSTNLQLKEAAESGCPEFSCIVASEQTKGRGRRGREFCSMKDSGVYLSMLLKPNIPLSKTGLITGAAAVAVCRTIKSVLGFDCQIKWVNDVYMREKKICGILTEGAADLETGSLAYAIVGIGVNVYVPQDGWPEDIAKRAGSLSDKHHADLRNRIAAGIINECLSFSRAEALEAIVQDYKQYSMMPGRMITVLPSRGDAVSAEALRINDDLSLQVRYEDGREEALNSGEVSIKL
ncbi:MAG: biotin--[acetyl-CoA-carboxylase] ligase [Eggerthellaceae bacterium]